MNPSPAILVCECEPLFRGALKNFFLAAGYSRVELATSVREALASLRYGRYRSVLIGISKPFLRGRRMAKIAQRRQPEAKIFFLVSAEEQPFIKDTSFEYLIKEYAFSNLLELM